MDLFVFLCLLPALHRRLGVGDDQAILLAPVNYPGVILIRHELPNGLYEGLLVP